MVVAAVGDQEVTSVGQLEGLSNRGTIGMTEGEIVGRFEECTVDITVVVSVCNAVGKIDGTGVGAAGGEMKGELIGVLLGALVG